MISVFSPMHGGHNQYVMDAYSGLASQTDNDWEWVIAPHDGAVLPPAITSDSRVKVFPYEGGVNDEDGIPRIGMLKRYCCERTRGDILVELDTDDILTSDCLHDVRHAVKRGAGFVYSNSAQFIDGSWLPRFYSEAFGWRHRPYRHEGLSLHVTLQENIAWPPIPQSMRLIMWAPNHVRAWSKDCYWRVGGHDPKVSQGDDHHLVTRTYCDTGTKGMEHIDKCLYLYRERPGENTCKVYVDHIQRRSWNNYHEFFPAMMRKWCDEYGLRSVELGAHQPTSPWQEAVDLHGGTIRADLTERWPFEDGEVGMIRAWHLFEHLPDKLHTMSELHRVLAPGGWATIEVPSTEGPGAWADPTHVSYWNEACFRYWTDKVKADFLSVEVPRFQQCFARTYTPGWGETEKIQVTRVDLLALKPPYDERPVGEVLI